MKKYSRNFLVFTLMIMMVFVPLVGGLIGGLPKKQKSEAITALVASKWVFGDALGCWFVGSAGAGLVGYALNKAGLGSLAELLGLGGGPDPMLAEINAKLDIVIEQIDLIQNRLASIENKLEELRVQLHNNTERLAALQSITTFQSQYGNLSVKARNATVELYKLKDNYQRVLDKKLSKDTYNEAFGKILSEFYTSDNTAYFSELENMYSAMTTASGSQVTQPGKSYYALLRAAGAAQPEEDYMMFVERLYVNYLSAVTICSAAMKFELETKKISDANKAILKIRMVKLHDNLVGLFNYFFGDPTVQNPASELKSAMDAISGTSNPNLVFHLVPGESKLIKETQHSGEVETSIARRTQCKSANNNVAIVKIDAFGSNAAASVHTTVTAVALGLTEIIISNDNTENRLFIAVSNNPRLDETATRNNYHGTTTLAEPIQKPCDTTVDLLSHFDITKDKFDTFEWETSDTHLATVDAFSASITTSATDFGRAVVTGSRKTEGAWETLSVVIKTDCVERDADGFLQISNFGQFVTELRNDADKIILADNIASGSYDFSSFTRYKNNSASLRSQSMYPYWYKSFERLNEIPLPHGHTGKALDAMWHEPGSLGCMPAEFYEGRMREHWYSNWNYSLWEFQTYRGGSSIARFKALDSGFFEAKDLAILSVPFSGEINGNGKRISANSSYDNFFIFNSIDANGKVYNLTFDVGLNMSWDGYFSPHQSGGIALYNFGYIGNCNVTGYMYAFAYVIEKWWFDQKGKRQDLGLIDRVIFYESDFSFVLFAMHNYGIIANCVNKWAEGNFAGANEVARIAYTNHQSGFIIGCYDDALSKDYGHVASQARKRSLVYYNRGTIANSYVISDKSNAAHVQAENEGVIINSFAAGSGQINANHAGKGFLDTLNSGMLSPAWELLEGARYPTIISPGFEAVLETFFPYENVLNSARYAQTVLYDDPVDYTWLYYLAGAAALLLIVITAVHASKKKGAARATKTKNAKQTKKTSTKKVSKKK